MIKFNRKSGRLVGILILSLRAAQSATAQENPVIPLSDIVSKQGGEHWGQKFFRP